jgi:hypothetical protein
MLSLIVAIVVALLLKDVVKFFLLRALVAFQRFCNKHGLQNYGLAPWDPRYIKSEHNKGGQ